VAGKDLEAAVTAMEELEETARLTIQVYDRVLGSK
jgi:ribulose-5-phosphate 4-epimerase/fuculose-1-phosphate aldolase